MRTINALSQTPDAEDWLSNTRQPRILHVFDHACNLRNEHMEVLSIVHPKIGNGPFNLVVEDKVLFSDYLNVQSPVLIMEKQLILGTLLINTTDAKYWTPRPDWESLHVRKAQIFSRAIKLKIPITSYPFATSGLSLAFANADVPSARKQAAKLAGLGAGLTPSGDDFILGAVYAAWILHPPAIASELARAVISTAAPLTTSLSAAWLRSAGRGDAGALWHAFFFALVSGDLLYMQKSMERILTMGETSGVDALNGFIKTFSIWMESDPVY